MPPCGAHVQTSFIVVYNRITAFDFPKSEEDKLLVCYKLPLRKVNKGHENKRGFYPSLVIKIYKKRQP